MTEDPRAIVLWTLTNAVRRMSLPTEPTFAQEMVADAEAEAYTDLVIEALDAAGLLA